jgi:hypothetical protein
MGFWVEAVHTPKEICEAVNPQIFWLLAISLYLIHPSSCLDVYLLASFRTFIHNLGALLQGS